MFQVLLVGVGGFIGAILRYGLSGMVHRYTHPGFPWGTLLVNVLGCLVIGAVMCLVEYRQVFSPHLRLFVVGFPRIVSIASIPQGTFVDVSRVVDISGVAIHHNSTPTRNG